MFIQDKINELLSLDANGHRSTQNLIKAVKILAHSHENMRLANATAWECIRVLQEQVGIPENQLYRDRCDCGCYHAPAATPSDTPKPRPFDEIHEEYRKKLMPKDAKPSEPTVDDPWWFEREVSEEMKQKWSKYFRVTSDESSGLVDTFFENGEPSHVADWFYYEVKKHANQRLPGEPEAVRHWREEHEEKPRQALPGEVEFWRNKADNLTTQLAGRDKTIAELTNLKEAYESYISEKITIFWGWNQEQGKMMYYFTIAGKDVKSWHDTKTTAIAAARAGKEG